MSHSFWTSAINAVAKFNYLGRGLYLFWLEVPILLIVDFLFSLSKSNDECCTRIDLSFVVAANDVVAHRPCLLASWLRADCLPAEANLEPASSRLMYFWALAPELTCKNRKKNSTQYHTIPYTVDNVLPSLQ